MSHQFVFGRYRCDGCYLDRINEIKLPQMLKFASMSFHAINPPGLNMFDSIQRKLAEVIAGSTKDIKKPGTFDFYLKLFNY